WIPEIKSTGFEQKDEIEQWTQWLAVEGPQAPANRRELVEHLSSLIVFDLLTNNSDRFSGGNLVASPDMHFLYFLDNTMGFQADHQGHGKCVKALHRVERFSRRFPRALRALSEEKIREELAREPDPPYEILSAEEIQAVVDRRDIAVNYIDQLIQQYGEDR